MRFSFFWDLELMLVIFFIELGRQCVAQHPLEVLNHTVLHDYVELADKAAELSVSRPLSEAVTKLTAPGLLLRYVRFISISLHLLSLS